MPETASALPVVLEPPARHELPRAAEASRLGGPRALALGAAVAFLAPALLLAFIIGPEIAGGDSGQWLMLSRAYLGEPTPAYRDTGAVPPAAPVMLAGLVALTGDPFLAHRVALAVAFGFLALATFLLGRELFGWLPGLVAAFAVAAGQRFFLHLGVFGALPQLLAVGSFAAALAAVAHWSRAPTPRNQAFIALAALACVASHAPTSAVVVPVLGLVLLAVPAGEAHRRRRVRGLAARVAPVVPAGAVFVLYARSRSGTFEQYVSNEAAYSMKGLAFALGELLRFHATVVMLLAAAAVLAVVLARGLGSLRRARGQGAHANGHDPAQDRAWRTAAAVLALPAGAFLLLLVGLHVARVGLDYQRVLPLVALPALVSLGALVPPLAPRALRAAPPSREARAFALGAVLLLATVGGVVTAERQDMAYYSVRSPDDLRSALAEVEQRVPQGATVWTPIREGKWLEGVTGRAALFGLQPWAIYRPWEWDRLVAADVLASGSAWASNGAEGLVFQRSPLGGSDNPVVRVAARGEPHALLRLDDGASRLRVLLPGPVDVPLASLGNRTEVVREEPAGAVVEQSASGTLWTWSGQPVKVEVLRRGVVPRAGDEVLLELTVRVRGAPLDAASLALRPAGGPWSVEPGPDGPRVASAGGRPAARLQAGPAGAELVPAGGSAADGSAGFDLPLTIVPGAASQGSEARATLRIAAEPDGAPARALRTHTADAVLRDHGVGWALMPRDEVGGWHASALALGFRPAYENPSYVLYEREVSA